MATLEPSTLFAETRPAACPAINDSLLAICQAMGSSLELREVLPAILKLSLHEMQAQQGSILLFDRHQDQLEMLASAGLPEEVRRKGYIPRKGSIAEWVIDNDQPLILNDPAQGGDYCALDERRIFSSMCLPLRAQGNVLGTINLNRANPEAGPFLERDLDVMMILASQAAICIENSRLHEANLKSERLAAIGQTVAGISHCIKNILTGIRGGMSLIDMASSAEEWTLLNQGKDILARNLERLSSIVLDMLDYSKDRTPCKSDIGIRGLAEEVIGTIHSEAQAKEIDLETRLDAETKSVQADGQQLYRCLLNLVHNAVEATPQGGKVWIGAERRTQPSALRRLKDPAAQAAIVLRVGDSGPGIDSEHLPVIFEPFFSTKGSKGTGLGLAVTRKIIEEHGGHIEVESRPGEPAVFAIYLPA